MKIYWFFKTLLIIAAIAWLAGFVITAAQASNSIILRYGVGASMTKTQRLDPVGDLDLAFHHGIDRMTGVELFVHHTSSIPDTTSDYDVNVYGVRGYIQFNLGD